MIVKKIITAAKLLVFDRGNLVRIIVAYLSMVRVFLKYKLLIKVNTHEKNLLINCGANIGQSNDFFERLLPTNTDYILIEPNPHCCAILREKFTTPNYKIVEAAVWVSEGEVMISGLDSNQNRLSQAATISSGESGNSNDRGLMNVKSLDLADFIQSLSSNYDNIYMKMDIEGAEYPVLEHMMATDSFSLINDIYIEFHPWAGNTFMGEGFDLNEFMIRLKKASPFYYWL